MSMPSVPRGSGECPILFVTISACDMTGSTPFYGSVFGWRTHEVSPDVSGAQTPGGPNVALRSDAPAGFPPMVPFVGVRDVEATLERVVSGGGTVERGPWPVAMAGTLARFRDPSGTLYGLTSALPTDPIPRIEAPFGSNPKPTPGSICSIEMYAADRHATGAFFRDVFGWGSAETMPHYRGFDPGAGIGGVFQSHTPTAPAMTYIYVNDVSDAIAKIRAWGGKPLGDPMSAPGMGTFGYFVDPSGSAMALIGP
ncbi:MAG: VOC family protein [Vicinamibacteria bacterium]